MKRFIIECDDDFKFISSRLEQKHKCFWKPISFFQLRDLKDNLNLYWFNKIK